MKKVMEWIAGKHLLPAASAVDLALGADLARELSHVLTSGKYADRLPPVGPLDTWLRFYRSHRAWRAVLIDAYRPVRSGRKRSSQYYAEIDASLRLLVPRNREFPIAFAEQMTPAEWERIRRRAYRLLRLFWRWKTHEWSNVFKDLESSDSGRMASIMQLPEMGFLMRVWLPCVLFYGEYPTNLLRRARGGDLEALDMLLKLDKSLIFEPRIAELFRQESLSSRRARYLKICKSLQSLPRQLTEKQSKMKAAALIKCMMPGGIDTPEIRKLFDGVAAASTSGKAISDTALPESPEAMQKAVRREVLRQKLLPVPDKN